MTDLQAQAREGVVVEQCDRDAAAEYLAALVPSMPLLAEAVRGGQTALARAFARHRVAALQSRADGVEKAWHDGFQCARSCLSDDLAFYLTDDVEQDAWADSATAVLNRTGGE